MFNNSQLCSQAPSPQREPHHAAWTAAGSLLCVCSVTLISSMSMFPHLSRLQRWDLCCCFNNTAWYCPGGSLLCVSGCSLFSPICYAVYPNMERGAFQALHVMHRRTGTTCTYCGRKTNSLQEKWKFLVKSCLSSFKFFHLRWFSFFSTHIPPQWYMNGQTLVLLAVWMLCRRTMSYYVCFVHFELKGDATANRGYYMQTRRLLNYLADIWLWIKTGCQHVDMTGVRIRFNLNIFSWLNLNWNLPHFAFRSC